MKRPLACLAALMTLGTAAYAAGPVYITLDHSNESLMEPATAQALWQKNIPARLIKLYPPRQWGFVSEVSGGFTANKSCVVAARAMMLPASGKKLIYKPSHAATAFDTLPNATEAQCKDLAKAKLKEAIDGVLAGTTAPN